MPPLLIVVPVAAPPLSAICKPPLSTGCADRRAVDLLLCRRRGSRIGPSRRRRSRLGCLEDLRRTSVPPVSKPLADEVGRVAAENRSLLFLLELTTTPVRRAAATGFRRYHAGADPQSAVTVSSRSRPPESRRSRWSKHEKEPSPLQRPFPPPELDSRATPPLRQAFDDLLAAAVDCRADRRNRRRPVRRRRRSWRPSPRRRRTARRCFRLSCRSPRCRLIDDLLAAVADNRATVRAAGANPLHAAAVDGRSPRCRRAAVEDLESSRRRRL